MAYDYVLIGEGTSDIYSLSILCERIADCCGESIKMIEEFSKPVNGPITKNIIKVRLNQIKNIDVDLLICIADTDRGNNSSKIHSLLRMIEDCEVAWASKTIVGSPDRNLEAWLLEDEDCVKRILSIDGTRPLPFRSDDPKNRLVRLACQYGDDSINPKSLRIMLAKELNLGLVKRRSISFKRFMDEFHRILGAF